MRNLLYLVAVGAALMLAGCTVAPVPVPTSPASTVSGSATPTPSPVTTASSASPTSGIGDCELPTPAVMDWIDANLNGGESFPADHVRMVEVGEGDTPGEYWWVVVWERYSDEVPYYQTYLTNSPGSADGASATWINVGLSRVPSNDPAEQMWVRVSWTDDRLAQGKAAQAKAVACLPD